MTTRISWIIVFGAALTFTLVQCDEEDNNSNFVPNGGNNEDTECTDGKKSCPCKKDGTCDSGLICNENNVCIQFEAGDAPEVCQEMAEREVTCEWEEEEEDAGTGRTMQDAINESVAACADDCENGADLIEVDEDENETVVTHISGQKVQNSYECMYRDMEPFWECDDHNYFLELDNRNTCEALSGCFNELGVGNYVSIEWNSDYDYCEMTGDYYVRYN